MVRYSAFFSFSVAESINSQIFDTSESIKQEINDIKQKLGGVNKNWMML
jgi:hypothetical protein